MNKNRIRNFLLEFFYWLSVSFVLLPLLFLLFFEKNISLHLDDRFPKNDWSYTKNGEYVGDFDIPKEVRHEKKKLDQKNEWVIEKDISSELFFEKNRPAFLVGRIGDADKVFVNDCLIGDTGYNSENGVRGWWWGKLRLYEIPKICLINDTHQKIRIEILHWAFANGGLYNGPIGVGEFTKLVNKVEFIDFLKFDIYYIYFFIFLAIGTYYLFVSLMFKGRPYYFAFTLFCFSTAFYELCISSIPYKMLGNGSVLATQINLFFGVTTTFLTVMFFEVKFNLFNKKKILKIFGGVFALLIVASFFMRTANQVYVVYSLAMLVGIVYCLLAFYFFTKRFLKDLKYEWRYYLAYTMFMVCIFTDIYISLTLIHFPYIMPLGFAFMVVTAALSLAKEYSDAFLYVEAQVEDRTRDLNQAIEDLKGLEKMKQRFFANISHDLKTPITVALGAIEETKSRFANVLGEALSPADRSLHKLKTMVSSILDSVKAESGELALQWQSVPVQTFLKDIAQDAYVLARQSNVEFDLQSTGFEGLQVPMDSGKMQRVMENIISNAVKYTAMADRSLKKVSIHLKTDQSLLHIYVDDSGIGVPAQERDKVFDRYVQSSLTDLKLHGGSGIGLSFVREMIDLHNGQVEMLESPMGGSRVHIQLPLSQDVTLTEASQLSSKNSLRGSLDVQYPPTQPKNVDPSMPILLICEDNPEVAQIIWNALHDHYNVYFAENGRAGLALLERMLPDCILSDVQMPLLDGHGFLAAVRKNKYLDTVPFIFLTSLGADQDVIDGFKMGASDYIAKPFKKEVLLTRIKAHVERKAFFERLSRSEKMSTIGTMFAGIAHEMKNPLQSLVNNQSMIQKIVKDKKFEEKYDTLERSITAARKKTDDLTDLISTVNEYSSGSEIKTTIDLKKKTRDVLSLLENKRKEKNFLQVNIHEPDEPIFIEGYNSVQQAMMNLVSNAFDATQNKSTDQIDIYLSKTDTQALFEVQDTGTGITPRVLPHIFDPFVTTKDPTKGTGLGLFLSKTIVEEKHGGLIKVQTQEGVGTRFTIALPLIAPDHNDTEKPFHSTNHSSNPQK